MNKITSLSAGYAIYAALKEALGEDVTAVYPVVSTENAALPYAVYYRSDSQGEPTKQGKGFDTCTVTIEIYDSDYDNGVRLAEVARSAIERRQLGYTDMQNARQSLTVDCSRLVDSSEDWAGDSFRQTIIFNCRMI